MFTLKKIEFLTEKSIPFFVLSCMPLSVRGPHIQPVPYRLVNNLLPPFHFHVMTFGPISTLLKSLVMFLK